MGDVCERSRSVDECLTAYAELRLLRAELPVKGLDRLLRVVGSKGSVEDLALVLSDADVRGDGWPAAQPLPPFYVCSVQVPATIFSPALSSLPELCAPGAWYDDVAESRLNEVLVELLNRGHIDRAEGIVSVLGARGLAAPELVLARLEPYRLERKQRPGCGARVQ